MARIRFTLGDSEIWHEFQIENYELSNSVFRDEHDLSYIIKREQDKCKDYRARKVEVMDDNGDVIATSSDILEWGKLEYNKKNN